MIKDKKINAQKIAIGIATLLLIFGFAFAQPLLIAISICIGTSIILEYAINKERALYKLLQIYLLAMILICTFKLNVFIFSLSFIVLVGIPTIKIYNKLQKQKGY